MNTIVNPTPSFLSIILVALLLSVSGCSDSSSSDGPTFNTSINGLVFLMDDREHLLSEQTGILVTLTSPGNAYQTVSVSHGSWEIKGLQPGSYDIGFSKPGFTEAKLFRVEVIEGKPAVAATSFLYAPPQYTVIFDAVTISSVAGVEGGVYMHTSENSPIGILPVAAVIAGRSPSLSIGDTSTYMICAVATGRLIATKDTVQDLQADLYLQALQLKFTKGETVYFRAYPYPYKGTYYDQNTSKDVITGYGIGSNVLSAVMQ